MTAQPLPQLVDDFAARARAAGHTITHLAPGRWVDDAHPFPTWSPLAPDGELTPNDLLDLAHDAARDQTAWIHAVVPTYTDAIRLAAAVQPTTPVVPRQATRPATTAARQTWRQLVRRPSGGRRGDPRRLPFPALVAEVPLSVVTHTTRRAGRPIHVVEIPAAWLTRPLQEIPR